MFRKFYKDLKSQMTEYKPQNHTHKDKDRTDEILILEQWKGYFQKLINKESETKLDDIHGYISKLNTEMISR